MASPSPSPFEIGARVGGAISQGINDRFDTSAIDQILSSANASGDPNAFNDAMGQIISRVSPRNQQQALAILQNRQQQLQQSSPSILDKFANQEIPSNNQKLEEKDSVSISSSNNNQFDPRSLSRSQLDILSASENEQDRRFAAAEIKQRDIAAREMKPFTQADIKRSSKFLEGVDESRQSVGRKFSALSQMEEAFKNRDLGFFSRDNMASFFGRFGKGLVSSEGKLADNAVKEFLISDLERIKGRPNQFIESRILSMMAQVGNTQEANLTVTEAMKSHVLLEKLRIDKADELENQFREQGKPIPGNIASLVDEAMKPESDEIERATAFRMAIIRDNAASESDIRKLANKRAKKDSVLTPRLAEEMIRQTGSAKAGLERAKSLGYIIPTQSEANRYLE